MTRLGVNDVTIARATATEPKGTEGIILTVSMLTIRLSAIGQELLSKNVLAQYKL